jgi:hypothetical protein
MTHLENLLDKLARQGVSKPAALAAPARALFEAGLSVEEVVEFYKSTGRRPQHEHNQDDKDLFYSNLEEDLRYNPVFVACAKSGATSGSIRGVRKFGAATWTILSRLTWTDIQNYVPLEGVQHLIVSQVKLNLEQVLTHLRDELRLSFEGTQALLNFLALVCFDVSMTALRSLTVEDLLDIQLSDSDWKILLDWMSMNS